MRQELIELTESYNRAGDAILDAIRDSIRGAGGFLNTSNNDQEKKDMKALVYDSGKGYPVTLPIRALRVNEKGDVEAYIGKFDTWYTDKYLRGERSEDGWKALRGSNILFSQTILSIADTLDDYLA